MPKYRDVERTGRERLEKARERLLGQYGRQQSSALRGLAYRGMTGSSAQDVELSRVEEARLLGEEGIELALAEHQSRIDLMREQERRERRSQFASMIGMGAGAVVALATGNPAAAPALVGIGSGLARTFAGEPAGASEDIMAGMVSLTAPDPFELFKEKYDWVQTNYGKANMGPFMGNDLPGIDDPVWSRLFDDFRDGKYPDLFHRNPGVSR